MNPLIPCHHVRWVVASAAQVIISTSFAFPSIANAEISFGSSWCKVVLALVQALNPNSSKEISAMAMEGKADDVEMMTCAAEATTQRKWWQGINGFMSYKAHNCALGILGMNGAFFLLCINAMFAVMSLNAVFSVLSVNSFGSALSFNSCFSILSYSSMFSVGCSHEAFKICF
jgi:hypothetical protein